MKTKLIRALLFWSCDLFELFCIGAFIVALGMCCSAYTHAGETKPHKIETRAPEYEKAARKPRHVRLARLEMGDEH